jgi:hypothetical protein
MICYIALLIKCLSIWLYLHIKQETTQAHQQMGKKIKQSTKQLKIENKCWTKQIANK